MALNNTVPDKNPGDLHFSSEVDEVTIFQKNQGNTQGTFDPANILIDGTGQYSNYNHGDATLVLNTLASVATSGNNYKRVKITFSQNCTVSFTGNFDSDQLFGLPASNLFNAGTYLFVFYHDQINSKVGFISPGTGGGVTPSPVEFSNFRIDGANPDRILFDASTTWTGTTFAGFTLATPSKTITSMVNNGTSGSYFVVSVAYDSGDTGPTIAYDGSDDITSAGGDLASFTATSIQNNLTSSWTTFNGSTTHIYFGNVLDSIFSATDKKWALEIATRNWDNSSNSLRLFSNWANTAADSLFSTIIRDTANNSEASINVKAGDGNSSNSKTVESTTSYTNTEQTIRFEYDGSIDSSALDRIDIFFASVVQGKSEIPTGLFPWNMVAGTREFAFGRGRKPDGTFFETLEYNGDARNLKVESWNGSNWELELFVQDLSTGVDSSGNGRNGTFVA